MITTHKSNLVARCKERGYTLDEVMPCVVSQDGDEWTIDVDSPAYPRLPKPGFAQPDEVPPAGPGTELKALLGKIGIVSSPTCSCNARARTMDEMEAKEPGWCLKNIDTIVGWLGEEAAKRKLPFSSTAANLLVRYAVRRALKK
jgi:hypothetical protein